MSKEPTVGERAAWQKLRTLRDEGFSFRREHEIGRYRADFVCLRKRVIVEVDGGVHRMQGAAERDAKRDAWLKAEGFVVIRITDGEAYASEAWLDRVRAALNAQPGAPYRWKTAPRAPLPLEGGGAGVGVRSKDANVSGRRSKGVEEGSESYSVALTPPPAPSPSRGGGSRFWEHKTLQEMTDAEWESLCDGCGKCCLISLEDEETGELYFTDVSCKLFNGATCQCSDYANRKSKVPDCVKLTPENVPTLDWLPRTCAYRLIAAGKPLAWWHPLVSGDPETVHTSGASARGQTRPEGRLKTAGLMKRIREWPEPAAKPPSKRVKK